ncbi:MAG TPA: hypothetical protein PKE31_02715, partial [Pseudomonadota bacterium]|nr:hypothetical protein [Pseudomonadota bacterium]
PHTPLALFFLVSNHPRTPPALFFLVSNHPRAPPALFFLVSNHPRTPPALFFLVSSVPHTPRPVVRTVCEGSVRPLWDVYAGFAERFPDLARAHRCPFWAGTG